MAVAVKKEVEKATSGKPAIGLPGVSLATGIYTLVGAAVVYHGVPDLYDLVLAQLGVVGTGFLVQGLRLLAVIAAAVGLIVLGRRVLPTCRGGKAGAAFTVVFLILGAAVVYWLCRLAESLAPTVLGWFMAEPQVWLSQNPDRAALWIGGGIALVATAAWLVLLIKLLRKPTFQTRLVDWENQGWFSTRAYKKGQGLLIRRATMLGVLLLAGTGLWTYIFRKGFSFQSVWGVPVPFNPVAVIVVLRAPAFTIGVVLAALSLWLAYRLVNYPRFADFLIATEAEMNKVSWTSRDRLIQDTIVVLVTVALMAVYLFGLDYFWSFVLTKIGVLRF